MQLYDRASARSAGHRANDPGQPTVAHLNARHALTALLGAGRSAIISKSDTVAIGATFAQRPLAAW
jgi:hypothetical protein